MKTTKPQTKWNTFVNASAAPGGATAGDIFSGQLELTLLKEERVFAPYLKLCPIHGVRPLLVRRFEPGSGRGVFSIVCSFTDCPMRDQFSDSDSSKVTRAWNLTSVLLR